MLSELCVYVDVMHLKNRNTSLPSHREKKGKEKEDE
jgi:hypothetical protein